MTKDEPSAGGTKSTPCSRRETCPSRLTSTLSALSNVRGSVLHVLLLELDVNEIRHRPVANRLGQRKHAGV